MIITSTNDIKDYKITKYLGLINVNVVIGANFWGRRDFLCLAKYHREPVEEEVNIHDTM